MSANTGKRLEFLKIEKVLYASVMIVFILFTVFVVFSKASMSKMNIEVERLKVEINEKENRIECLTMKINELSSLENISMVASEMGLSYNNDNVKVIK
jgi:cell division protein FtsL